MKNNTINKKEIEKFSKIAEEWWNPEGKFKPLHKFNPIRISYIKNNIITSFKLKNKTDYLKFSKYIIVVLSIISFIVASKGFDILYLFLLADLFCCAFVLTVFYSFYNKNINEKTAYISIIVGLIAGFLMFPFPDFSKSLLVGVLLPKEIFTPLITQSLLFWSFLVATFLPTLILKIRKV